jgi:hypothetical protein
MQMVNFYPGKTGGKKALRKTLMSEIIPFHAPVAQLDRAIPS